MSESDLRARPIYHHKRESIEAHLTIVMAALAVSHWLEQITDTSIKKIVQTLRRHRSIAVQTGRPHPPRQHPTRRRRKSHRQRCQSSRGCALI